MQNFQSDLENHVFIRLLGEELISTVDRSRLLIKGDKLYLQSRARINYTAYDVRIGQDCLDSSRHPDIMTVADSGEYPFLFARVLGFFHLKAAIFDPDRPTNLVYRHLNIAWVHWFRIVSGSNPFVDKRLPKLAFIDSSDRQAFGFIDPDVILRATHLIPSFKDGLSASPKPPSLRPKSLSTDEALDYAFYYVGM